MPLRISKFGSPYQLLYSTKLFRNILLLTTDHSSVIIAVFPVHGQTPARRKGRANKESINLFKPFFTTLLPLELRCRKIHARLLKLSIYNTIFNYIYTEEIIASTQDAMSFV